MSNYFRSKRAELEAGLFLIDRVQAHSTLSRLSPEETRSLFGKALLIFGEYRSFGKTAIEAAVFAVDSLNLSQQTVDPPTK